MYQKSANTFIVVVHLTINFFSNNLPAFSCCFHCSIHLLPLSSTHYYWHISQIIIIFKGELLLSKCNCILVISYPLSPPFPFDHNYTCRRVKWSEHGGMGPMQHSLTTATPFKSQEILFKARELGSNLIHRKLSTSQLPILDPPSPVTWFTSFFSRPPTPYGLPTPPSFARFCDTRISSSLFWIMIMLRANHSTTTRHKTNKQSG